MVDVGGFWKLLWELGATNLSLEGKHITWTAVLSFLVCLQEEQVQAFIYSLFVVQPIPLLPAGLHVCAGAHQKLGVGGPGLWLSHLFGAVTKA